MNRLLLNMWGVWDWVYFKLNRMHYVGQKDNVFRVVRKIHDGPPLLTQCGKWIRPGDEVLKIHLHNYRLARKLRTYPSEISFAFYLRKHVRQSLHGLCDYIEQLPNGQNIRGLVGTSMLNRTAERFGFNVHDVRPCLKNTVKNVLYKLIFVLMHPEGARYVWLHGHRLCTKHLVMAVEDLYERYSRK